MTPSECAIGTRITYRPRWANGAVVKAIIEKEQVPNLTYLVRVQPEGKTYPVDTDLVSIGLMSLDTPVTPGPQLRDCEPLTEQAPTASEHRETWRPNRDNTAGEWTPEDTAASDDWKRIQQEHLDLHRRRSDLANILKVNADDVLCGLSYNAIDGVQHAMDLEENTYKIRKLAHRAYQLVLSDPRD